MIAFQRYVILCGTSSASSSESECHTLFLLHIVFQFRRFMIKSNQDDKVRISVVVNSSFEQLTRSGGKYHTEIKCNGIRERYWSGEELCEDVVENCSALSSSFQIWFRLKLQQITCSCVYIWRSTPASSTSSTAPSSTEIFRFHEFQWSCVQLTPSYTRNYITVFNSIFTKTSWLSYHFKQK